MARNGLLTKFQSLKLSTGQWLSPYKVQIIPFPVSKILFPVQPRNPIKCQTHYNAVNALALIIIIDTLPLNKLISPFIWEVRHGSYPTTHTETNNIVSMRICLGQKQETFIQELSCKTSLVLTILYLTSLSKNFNSCLKVPWTEEA